MNEIVIAYITDDNYVMPTIVSITSAIMNKNESSIYKFYIIGVSINEENKKIIDEFITKNTNDKIHLNILHFNQHYDFDDTHPYVTSAAIFKFDIANILSDFDKVLYIDCDTIILKDLTELFNIDINEYYAAVVKDYYVMEKLKHNEKIGIENYFNSGVMLLNIKLLIEINIKDVLLYNKTNRYNFFMDQDAFNYSFNNKAKFIHPKYNYIIDTIQQVDTKTISEFYKADINEPIVIMHLAGPKPFNKDMPYINYFYDFWNYYQYTDYFKNNPIWAINKISEQKLKSLDNNINRRLEEINNDIRNIYLQLEDLSNKIINEVNYLKNKANDFEIETNKRCSENWIKFFGVYNNREYIFIYIFFIKFRIRMTEKNIKNISWWIPVRKWRDEFRNKFRSYYD